MSDDKTKLLTNKILLEVEAVSKTAVDTLDKGFESYTYQELVAVLNNLQVKITAAQLELGNYKGVSSRIEAFLSRKIDKFQSMDDENNPNLKAEMLKFFGEEITGLKFSTLGGGANDNKNPAYS